MKRKGQAAMEFLMTYGWAILAAIIVIAVLAYYFRPSEFGSGASRLNAPFTLVDHNIQAANGPNMIIRNDGVNAVQITNINVLVNGNVVCSTGAITEDLTAGGVTATPLVAVCTPALTAGGSFTGNVEISYTTSGGTLTQKSTGVISGTVQ